MQTREPRLFGCSPHAPAQVASPAREFDAEQILRELRTLVRRGREGLRMIEDLIERLRENEPLRPRHADLHQSLDLSLLGIRASIGDRVRLLRHYSNVPPLPCNPSMLQQAFENVLKNAVQSIAGNGEIAVSTRTGHGHAIITIRDDGSGIADDVRPRIFEPFFTARPPGEGLGLGLPISLAIVQRHAGHMEVSSRPGAFTEVRFHLPLASADDRCRTTH